MEAESVLTFIGYDTEKITFLNKNIEPPSGEIELRPFFGRHINKEDDGKFSITLGVKVGFEDKSEIPFACEVIITGHFQLSDHGSNDTALIDQNATAILFPYLRSLVTSITANANVSPIFLAVMNISKLFEDVAMRSEDKEKPDEE